LLKKKIKESADKRKRRRCETLYFSTLIMKYCTYNVSTANLRIFFQCDPYFLVDNHDVFFGASLSFYRDGNALLSALLRSRADVTRRTCADSFSACLVSAVYFDFPVSRGILCVENSVSRLRLTRSVWQK